MNSDQIELIRRGMWRVVNEGGGTGGRSKSEITVISGKTGTAQTGNTKEPTNAWFIAFAPYENPEIAVCVFVQNGKSGGGAASPIAKNIIEHAMTIKKGTSTIDVTKVPEAVGNRKFVSSVSFDNQDLVAAFNQSPSGNESDEDTAVDVAEFVPNQLLRSDATPSSESYVSPTIRSQVDNRGSVGRYNTDSTSWTPSIPPIRSGLTFPLEKAKSYQSRRKRLVAGGIDRNSSR